MSAIGIVNIQVLKDGEVVHEQSINNKWTSQFVYDLFYYSIVNVGTTFNPNKIYLSSYANEISYTNTSTSIFSGYINTSFSYTTSTYSTVFTDACYESSAELNANDYPCIMRTYNYPYFYTPNSSATGYYDWEPGPEAFWVDELHTNQDFLSAPVTAGNTVIPVYDGTNFRAGEWIRINDFKGSDSKQIISISTNDLTLDSGLGFDHKKGTTINGHSLLAYTGITTLSSSVSAGVNILPVVDESAFSSGNRFMLYDSGNNKWEGLTVDSTGANQILITGGIANAYDSGSKVLRGFTGAHAGDNYTITNRWPVAGKYMEWILSDTDATGYGATPIRTIAITNSAATTIYASVLLPEGIYKDSSTNLITMRIGWNMMLKAH